MRESWTDGRLDDLSCRMDAGFDRVDADLRDIRTEMNARFDSMHRTMIQFAGVMIAALIGLMATQLGLIIALL